jgi:hypothetical protein
MRDTATEQLIENVRITQKRMSDLLESVANDQDWQPAPGEWSFRYIAAHLATVDKDCYLDRVVRISSGENPYFESYFNTGWDFGQFDLSDSLHDWKGTRQKIVDLVNNIPEHARSLTGTHAAFGTITVLDVLRMMLDHDQEHLQHLQQILTRNWPDTGRNHK